MAGKDGRVSCFIMPGNALKSLNDELSIISGTNESLETLHRYGLRCGEGIVTDFGLTCGSREELIDALEILLAQTGLGRAKLVKLEGEEIVIDLEDSLEAAVIGTASTPNCHFTRGYLAGMISTLMGTKYECKEQMCVAKGDQYCDHHVVKAAEELVPKKEEKEEAPLKYTLEQGTGYVIKEEVPELCYKIFTDHIKHDFFGLCITREFPKKVRKKYSIESTPIIWLSTTEAEGAISPLKLSQIYHDIENFLSEAENSILMLSGIEYLISQNNYNQVLRFLQLLNEQIAIRDAILLIPISAATLDEKDLKMIEREFVVYDGE